MRSDRKRCAAGNRGPLCVTGKYATDDSDAGIAALSRLEDVAPPAGVGEECVDLVSVAQIASNGAQPLDQPVDRVRPEVGVRGGDVAADPAGAPWGSRRVREAPARQRGSRP